MGTPKRKKNILIVSKDYEFKKKIASSFPEGSQIFEIGSQRELEEKHRNREFSVLILDIEAFKNYNKKIIHDQYLALASQVIQKNDCLVSILFSNKTPPVAVTAKLDNIGIHALIDRRDFNVGTIHYLIRVFRSRSFRTIILDDVSNSFKAPATLYHFLPKNNRFVPILPKHAQYSDKVKNKLIETNTFQIYSKQETYKDILTSLSISNPSHEIISIHLNNIRDLYIRYLSNFFNLSRESNTQNGKDIFYQGQKIIEMLSNVMETFPSPIDCIQQLPYKRWSDISHSLNCAIFALIFGKELQIDNYREVAHIALYHNIGISQIDQKMAVSPAHQLSANDKAEYEKHVEHSICLLKKLRLPLQLWHYAVVYQHHECFDGTGYPNALAGKKILPQAELLSICGAFNHTLSMHNDNRMKSITEAWEILKTKNSFESAETKQAFSPETLKRIEQFIMQAQKQSIDMGAEELSASKIIA